MKKSEKELSSNRWQNKETSLSVFWTRKQNVTKDNQDRFLCTPQKEQKEAEEEVAR